MGERGLGRGGPAARAGRGPSWTLIRGAVSGSLTLRFVGPTATREVPDFLAALSDNMPARAAHITFDLRELEGQNIDTRAPIQRWLAENRSRIAQVTVLVKKAATIVKMAASVVALATGMKIEIRDDVEDDPSIRRVAR